MEEIITQLTGASALQYLAAFVSLVWLLHLTGVTRFRQIKGFAGDLKKPMLRWLLVVLLITGAGFLILLEDVAEPSFPVAAELKGISRIIDGDTIELIDGTRVRLHGIDTPERNQPYGKDATRELNTLLENEVYVEVIDVDRYGRTVAALWTSNGTNVNLQMVCRGAAWWYERYARDDAELRECQTAARDGNLGLWDGDPIEPWVWRKR